MAARPRRITSGSNSSATACSAWSSPNGCTSCSRPSPKARCRSASTRWSPARSAPTSRASSACRAHLRLGKQARDDGASGQRQRAGRRDGGADRRALSRSRPRRRARASSAAPGATASQAGAQGAAAPQVRAAGMGRRAQPQARPNMRSSTAPAPTTRRASRVQRRAIGRLAEADRGQGAQKQEARDAQRGAAAICSEAEIGGDERRELTPPRRASREQLPRRAMTRHSRTHAIPFEQSK